MDHERINLERNREVVCRAIRAWLLAQSTIDLALKSIIYWRYKWDKLFSFPEHQFSFSKRGMVMPAFQDYMRAKGENVYKAVITEYGSW